MGFDFDPENDSKSGSKRDSFFDAMRIARESSDVNGRHPFGVTYLCIHMIRSTIYIYIYTRGPSCKMHEEEASRRKYQKHLGSIWGSISFGKPFGGLGDALGGLGGPLGGLGGAFGMPLGPLGTHWGAFGMPLGGQSNIDLT